MDQETLAAALEREHREIDDGIGQFQAGLASGEVRKQPLTRAMDALRRHIYLEEELMFPSYRQGGLVAPVFVMLREHGEIWRDMDTLEAQLTNDGASDSIAEVCRELAARLELHNTKEEAILYPQADNVLPPETSDKLSRFMESGAMPDGWVCARARD